jgi:putative transposase
MGKRYFVIDAAVVLPDHIHCVWALPAGDADFATRWRLIKSFVTKRLSGCAATRPIRTTGNNKNSRSVWQHRYWEHLMRDESDYRAHIDYIHYNPVKHGYVSRPVDWPYSSIHRYVADGQMPGDWGANGLDLQENTGRE